MSSLRQVVFDLHDSELRPATKPPGDRRAGGDRRASERRANIYPFDNRGARLRSAAQAAGVGTFDLDCSTCDSSWSPELKVMAGLPPDKAPLSTEQVEALIHPKDRQRFLDKLQASFDPRGDGNFEDDHRLLRPDGKVVWVRAKGRTFFIGEGAARRPLATTGVVMDITANRVAEQALAENSAELDELVAAAIDSIVTIDADQRIIRFNPSAARMFDCPPEEALGSRVERFMAERHRAGHAEKVRRFAKGESSAQVLDGPRRFTGMRANGEEFPFEATITKVSVNGNCRMTTFMRDITDRVRADEALQRNKEDLELALRGANIGIWHWDLRTGQAQLSERCGQIFGISPSKPLTYEDLMNALHPDDRLRVEAGLRRTLEKGEDFKMEKRFVWPDGSIHWAECIGRELWDESGTRPVGVRGIALDITERKHQEEALLHTKEHLEVSVEERTAELMRANDALERSNLELQQFAFIAAHDLQTPLRSITGFAQLLQKDYAGRFDPQADLWLGQLVRNSQRMHELILDLLAYSRVESRGGAFLAIDCNQVFDDVVESLEAPIRKSGARVTRDALPTVMGDRTQLAQVLQNLIDNSLKYRGSDPPQIHVTAARGDGEWVFSVRDNGIGMDERHLEHIFDIFRRLHTQEQYPGTGIGLAVCRRVIHRHGGRIWAESKPGEGSTFFFSLPERKP